EFHFANASKRVKLASGFSRIICFIRVRRLLTSEESKMTGQTMRAPRARSARRATLVALIAAAAAGSLLNVGSRAYGNTYSFSIDLADMLDPTAWTPNGIP